MDCDTEDQGCNGGMYNTAFNYIIKYGLEPASAYPYKGVNENCHYNKSKVVAHIKAFKVITPNSTNALLTGIAMVPIATAVEAD